MNNLNKFGMLPWIAAIALFMQTLDATILNTALPTIANSFERSPLAMQSAVISYTLIVALLIPISGWLADRFGTRRVFIFAVILFSVGSFCCAISQSLFQLVISRVVQATGGAMMMPVARLAVLRKYPRNELLAVLSFITIPGLVGPIIGPLLGGLFVTYLSWHWIFIINIPIGLLGVLLALRYMPDFKLSGKPFDFIGFVFFSGSLVGIVVALELFGETNVSPLVSIFSLLLGGVLIFLYARHTKYDDQPLIDLAIFKTRTFTIGLLGNLISRLGVGSTPFLIPLMLQVGFGYSPLIGGIMMIPVALGSILAKSIITQLLSWFGYRKLLINVTLILGLMICLFYFQTVTTSLVLLFIPLFIFGMLMSVQFTSINTLALGYLSKKMASTGNSVLATGQQLSITLGTSISAIVLRFYNQELNIPGLDSFHYTFITMGCISLLSSLVFVYLKAHDGDELLSKK